MRWKVTGADVAEWFKVGEADLTTEGQSTLEAGELVCTDTTESNKVVICNAGSPSNLVGVVSSIPQLVMGEKYKGIDATRVALNGRAPIKVNLDGGDIAQGDRITVSTTEDGVGMKAQGNGRVVGIAMEPYTASSTSDTIYGFLNLQYYGGDNGISIDADGNIGIGTTTPGYKLHVIGDIAATSFVNISTKTSKKDISYVTDEEKGTILEKLEAVDVAEYHYNHEDEDAPMRLGLIAEEAPTDVLSAGGKGVDIYQLATFTIAGVQELADKVGDLEVRLSDVEAQVAAINTASGGGSGASLQSVIDYLVSVGVSFVEGVTHIASLVTGEIKTDKLCVGDTCVTENELKQLLASANISASTLISPTNTSTNTSHNTTSAMVVAIAGSQPTTLDRQFPNHVFKRFIGYSPDR